MPDVEVVDANESEQSALDSATHRRYRVFKKNAPYLYDYLSTHALTWPSLTVQFFPDLEQNHPATLPPNPESQLVLQRLLLGTFTLGQALDLVSIYLFAHYRNLNKCIDMDLWHYNPDKAEFEGSTVAKTRLRPVQTIAHRGDVNKLRYMPQNPDIVAAASRGAVLVYDRTKHASIKTILGDVPAPQLRLDDGSPLADIFAFDWNSQTDGAVVSASMDGHMGVYNITAASSPTCRPQWKHAASCGVNDVEWVPTHNAVFVAAEDDGGVRVYDTRAAEPASVGGCRMSTAANSVSVNRGNSFCVAAGSADGTLSVYDVRSLDTPVHTSRPHLDAVTQVKWHPSNHAVVGTCSADRLVKLHDMNRARLLFDHQGHMFGVNDFDWSHHDEWMVASVGDDNLLQVWRAAQRVLASLGST